MQTENLKEPISLEEYNNGTDDNIRKKVDQLWNQIIDPNINDEERRKIIDELIDRIEEHEIQKTSGISKQR